MLDAVRSLFWKCALHRAAARRRSALVVLPASAFAFVLCYYSWYVAELSDGSTLRIAYMPPNYGERRAERLASSGDGDPVLSRLAQHVSASFVQRPVPSGASLREKNASLSSAIAATKFDDSRGGSRKSGGGLDGAARAALDAASPVVGTAAASRAKALGSGSPPLLATKVTPPAASGAQVHRRSSAPIGLTTTTGGTQQSSSLAAPDTPMLRVDEPIACRLKDVHAQLYRFDAKQRRKQKRAPCPPNPPNLVGRIDTFNCAGNISDLEALDFRVDSGGSHRPSHCTASSKAAIIVPFRDRWPHLFTLLLNLHPFLQKHELQYTIFVINQADNGVFNKGILLNAGATMASTLGDYDCYIFHDIDLLPENDNNIYRCPAAFQHLSVAVDKFDYELPYVHLVGGVLAADKEAFAKVNGYSNLYYGWGGEDDDMAARIGHHGYIVKRYINEFSRYRMVRHGSDRGNNINDERFHLLQNAGERSLLEGLRSQVGNITGVFKHKLFTMVNVTVDRSYVTAKIERSILGVSSSLFSSSLALNASLND